MSDEGYRPHDALRTLIDHGVRFIVIGGFAGSIRGSPVITGDLDICYARDEDNLVRLAASLRELRAHLRGAPEDVPFQLDARSFREGDHFTFVTSTGSVDCLGTPAGTNGFADLDASATDEDIDGLVIRVASLDDLIRMKRGSDRTKDRIHLEWLSALRDELER